MPRRSDDRWDERRPEQVAPAQVSARLFTAIVVVVGLVVASCSGGGSTGAGGRDAEPAAVARVDARCGGVDDIENPPGTEPIEIFMYARPLSASDTDRLRRELDGDVERVECYRFLTHQDAYEEFKRAFSDYPDLVAQATPEDLPESFRVVPVRPDRIQEIVQRYRNAAGVYQLVAQPTPEDLASACERWTDGAELEIFMDIRAQPADVDALRSRLDGDELVDTVRFLTHQDAYEKYKEMFRDQPAMIDGTTPELLPESFRVEPVRSEVTPRLAREYGRAAGVQHVATVPSECGKS